MKLEKENIEIKLPYRIKDKMNCIVLLRGQDEGGKGDGQ